MNPNQHNTLSNFMQNDGSPPNIPNQQNNPYFINPPLIPNPHHNPNFQKSIFIPNLQNNPSIRNYSYHTSPYPYQYQQFSSQSTNPNMPHVVQIGSSGVESNDQEHGTPQFCTQVSLENTNLGEEVASAPVVNTPKQRFQPKEDEILIQSWLNVSKDSLVGVDQKGDSFWKRIGETFNKHHDMNYKERKPTALKGRWHKINPSVQKFVGCYKQALSTQKNGSSENNIMQAAYRIYFQDEGEKFTFESAWRLLKDEPKWLTGSSEASAKRTKNSASGAYSSSSNPPTPTSSEYNPSSPTLLRRPIGQKEAKRKEKEKIVEMSTPDVKYEEFKDEFKKKTDLMSVFAQDYTRIESERLEIEIKKVEAKIKKAEMKEERLKIDDLQILSKDRSNMNSRQLQAHDLLCDVIRKKYGLN
ncbi:glutathione S-transferase T3-like [Vicia villosa]|uniref:glutathione S-transferase T3-like n=1 Tax=Vicia villosa TaxID=3911 RepID=UPI00273C0240|nr:glutathione S-transferase T3-like [Vicia villosa]